MPKEIRSAADILGATAPAAEELPSALPPEAAPAAVAPAPEAGFEAPPPAEEANEVVTEEAPAAEAPSAADVLAQAAEPAAPPAPSAPAPTAVKESVIPAKPETLLSGPEDVNLTAAVLAKAAAEERPAPAPVAGRRDWRFVKNIHFGEKLVFEDGATYQFPRALHVISDPELAAKILKVASRYNIVLQ